MLAKVYNIEEYKMNKLYQELDNINHRLNICHENITKIERDAEILEARRKILIKKLDKLPMFPVEI